LKPRPEIPSGPYLVVGLARSGIAAALALRARGLEVIGVDAGTPSEMQSLAQAGVDLHLGEDGLALLGRVGAVVKSPGVAARAPVIAAARERGLFIAGELELGWRMLANDFIAVTGTNGKTTTVALIGHIHRAAGLPVAVAGNVGTALSALVGSLGGEATIVCETSSFQLEDTVCFAPEAAVLLNVTEDHLDRHGTMRAYLAAKLQVFARQDSHDIAVVPADLSARLASAGACASPSGEERPVLGRGRLVAFGAASERGVSLRDGQLWWNGGALLAVSELRLRGRHNVENAMAAAAVCLARGIDREAVSHGLRSFAGVAHRLEEVARREGVSYVNDSKATNVASTLVALDALAGTRRPTIHLILGGQGKGQDFTALRGAVERSCRAVYLIGQDAALIAGALAGLRTPVHRSEDLPRALSRSQLTARPGDVVLLSPACASFDQFDDFEARGEHFRALLRNGGLRAQASK
jgi:UDP-N-acetylmuramoylalanine--D-glutamate ligase